ncbi:MAG: 3-deoxy-D-manno-octulosonate 8-phosphate phosphatase [Bacteroidetes bacterium]|nr:3-deoxy-D-manno-octulosonate 8-phosphate phosphatase [Bacteroidota bacterium]
MNYKIKLKRIQHFIFDIDGVLTDGTVLINGAEFQRTIHSRDSYAIQYASGLGYNIFLISGGDSAHVKSSFESLGVTAVYLRSRDKLKVFNVLKEEYQIDAEDCLYMGDDIPDIPVMRAVGLATAPHDASIDVRAVAEYISPYFGGRGAVRDVIEQTLRVQQRWLMDHAYQW